MKVEAIKATNGGVNLAGQKAKAVYRRIFENPRPWFDSAPGHQESR